MLQWQSWLEAWQRIVVVIRDWNSPAAILNPSVRAASPSELRLHPTTARILRTLSVASCSESANFAFVEVYIPNLIPSHVRFSLIRYIFMFVAAGYVSCASSADARNPAPDCMQNDGPAVAI